MMAFALLLTQLLSLTWATPPSVNLGKSFPTAPIKDQGKIGFCWANAILSFLETRSLQTHHPVTLSANYFGMMYLYTEIQKVLPEMEILIQHQQELSKYTQLEAMNSVFERISFSRIQKKSPDTGNYYHDAIQLLDQVGAVPESVVTQPKFITQAAKTTPDLEKTYEKWAQSQLIQPKIVHQFIQEPRLLLNALAEIFELKPLDRNDEFEYDGSLYTPLSFKKRFLNLGSDNLIARVWDEDYPSDPDFSWTALMIEHQLSLKHEVPITLEFFALSHDDFLAQTKSGILSIDSCRGHCKSFGGHAVSVINTLQDSRGKVVAYLAKNSWGTKSQATLNATPTPDEKSGGYLVIPVDYLKEAGNIEFITEL